MNLIAGWGGAHEGDAALYVCAHCGGTCRGHGKVQCPGVY